MTSKVANAMRALSEPGERVAVAVSGGADSVALLWCLRELEVDLAVAHFNHQLRGEESDQDERFVTELAESLGLELYLQRGDVRAIAHSAKRNLEETARLERYRFLEGLVSRGAVDQVATGHTRSDQAETVLFRLLRGTGEDGLRGIRPALDSGVIRPMLEVSGQEARAYLAARGKSWREDSSNDDRRFSRNRIRRELLPSLARDWNPKIEETLSRTARLAQGDEDYWREKVAEAADEILTPRGEALLVDAGKLEALHPSLSRRLLREALGRIGVEGMPYDHIEALRRLEAGKLALPGAEAQRSFDWLRIQTDRSAEAGPASRHLVPPADLESPDGLTRLYAELRTTPPTDRGYNDSNWVYVDWNRVAGSARLRNWRAGDRFRPLGRESACLVKRLFHRNRVPEWDRRRWPVVVDEGENLIWMRGFGASADWIVSDPRKVALAMRETDRRGNEINSIESWALSVYS